MHGATVQIFKILEGPKRGGGIGLDLSGSG